MLLRPLCRSDESGKFRRPEARVSFCDATWPRPRSFSQLFAEFEMVAKLRAAKENIDAKIHFMRKLPRREVSEVFEPCHAA